MPAPEPFVTPEEYLRRERESDTRSEYYRGRIYAMTDGSRDHARVVLNLATALNGRVAAGCEVFAAILRLKVAADGLYTYPDVFVHCGSPRYEDERRDTALDATLALPTIGAEVALRELYDRVEWPEHLPPRVVREEAAGVG